MHHGTPQDMESDPDDEVKRDSSSSPGTASSLVNFALACVAAAILRVCACARACVCARVAWKTLLGCMSRTLLLPPLSAWPPCAWGLGRNASRLSQPGGLFTCLSSSSQVQWSRLPPQLVFHLCPPSHDMLNRIPHLSSIPNITKTVLHKFMFLFFLSDETLLPSTICLLSFAVYICTSLDWPH